MRDIQVGSKVPYSAEFRKDALQYLEGRSISFEQAAKDLGIDVTTLRSWRHAAAGRTTMAAKKKVGQAVPPSTPAALTPEAELVKLRSEKERLEKRVALLEMEREILKKAAAFFAKESE
jgi:transposase